MFSIQLTESDPSHWKYISEGGATIVFSYVGPYNANLSGVVLRLRKTGASITDDDDPSIIFQHRCMERLVPTVHLPKLQSVIISRSWLEALSETHNHERPRSRRDQASIDFSRTKGVLATDLVNGDIVSVEIKPKWSFLPNPRFLSTSTKTRTCRFCMHSSLKSLEGESVALGYCPLDLFSPDPNRIRKALHSLYDAWILTRGKINNLKIFVCGKKITVEERTSILAQDSPELTDSQLRAAFADALLPLLANTVVLRTLNKLQRTFDALDIEGLEQLWYRTHPDAPVLADGAGEPTLDEWSSLIDTYLSDKVYDHDNPSIEDLRYYVLAYLLSATFKDCSIIVRVDPIDSNAECVQIDPSRVSVIDLDPKTMGRLEKWKKLDQEIASTYNGEKVCIDDWKT